MASTTPPASTHPRNSTDFVNHSQQVTTQSSKSESGKAQKVSRNATFWQFGAVVCCFFSNIVSGSLISSYGIMYTYMQESLGVSIFQLTWIGSLMAGFQGFTSLIATVLIDVFGCRVSILIGGVLGSSGFICSSLTSNIHVLYFTLGVLPGVGFCLGYNASMVHVSRMFTKWRPLANGVCVAGSAVGMLAYPPLTTLMTDHFGWKGSLLLHAALFLHLLPAALLVEHAPSSAKKREEQPLAYTKMSHKIKNYLKIFRQPSVIFIALAHLFMGVGNPTFPTFIPEYAISGPLKLTTIDSALILTLAGFGNLFSRFVCSCLALINPKAPQVIYGTALLCVGIALLSVVLNRTWLQIMVNGAAYGLAYGAWPSTNTVVCVNLFGLENLSKTFGAFTFCQGIGSLCAPPLQSYLSGVLDNQDLIFYIGGGSFIVAFVIVVIVICSVTPFGFSMRTLKISPGTRQNGECGSFSATVSVNDGKCGINNKAFDHNIS